MTPQREHEEPNSPERDEAPETPLDEPQPIPVKDPPTDAKPPAPYVVAECLVHDICEGV